MAPSIPITLIGNNLGNRHQYLNGLVNDAFDKQVPFDTIQDAIEVSPIDRIFKIDLASKYRNIEYIVKILKDEDMLYVSRALKCHWLLESEYSHIVNPVHLEEVLFPEMILPAANKMLHWIQLNLKDSKRCEEFYEYYSVNNKFKIAIKFLIHCSKTFVFKKTTADTLEKLNPKYLEIILEKCPEIAMKYFKLIDTNETISNNFSNNNKIYNNMKKILKINADVFLDILETYCESDRMKLLGSATTKYIMRNHKERFLNKPELYTARFLDLKILGTCLNNDEIKDLLLKLARAKYLSHWFTYKTVEPLIKCLPPQERAILKKQIFVEKSFGAEVKEWPYKPPSRPVSKIDKGDYLFQDEYFHSISDDDMQDDYCQERYCCALTMGAGCVPRKKKTLLDELFDTYRFHNFDRTMFELRKKITSESSAQNRQYMMLVLVSKTGGHSTHLEELLQFLSERFTNEPANLRAAIVRSLVRRAFVWRAPETTWKLLLEFSHDLGLDGKTPAAACDEGLHAVVLRNFLADSDCNSEISKAYLKNYSTFSDYSLNDTEKQCVRKHLPTLVLRAAVSEVDNALEYFNILLDTLVEYHLRFTDCEGAVTAISDFVSRDCKKASSLIERLYTSRINRKEFFKENFTVIQTDQSYLNVLRHDADLLKGAESFKVLTEHNQLKHEGFLRKLALYFGEDDGLAFQYFNVLNSKIDDADQSNTFAQLARAFVLLAKGTKTINKLNVLESTSSGSTQKRLAAAILSNIHLSRPPVDLDIIGWPKAGSKGVTNKIIICKPKDLEKNIDRAMQWRRTACLSLNLALRNGNLGPVITSISKTRPAVAIKVALRYFRLKGNDLDLKVWDIIRPTIEKLDLTSALRTRLRMKLYKINSIPPIIQANFFVTVYKVMSEEKKYFSTRTIKRFLPQLPDEFVIDVCTSFLNTFEIKEHLKKPEEFRYSREWSINVEIIGNFLLMNKSEDIQKHKLESIGKKFFEKIEEFWKMSPVITTVIIKEFIGALTCSTVFVNPQYVDALPVYEKIITWLQKLLPMESYFNLFVEVHATILLYKSFRQIEKQMPSIFSEKIKWNVIADLVGTSLGKYLSYEIKELINQYFPSIKDLYQQQIFSYLDSVLYYHGENKNKLLTAFIKSFVIQASNENYKIVSPYIILSQKDCVRDTVNSMDIKSNNQEFAFFMSAKNIYSCF